MKEIFRHRELAMVTIRQAILEEAGIATVLKNEDIAATEASIPPFWPALYVIKDEEKNRAIQVIRERLAEMAEGVDEEIICPNCGESNPGNFDTCWSCEAVLRPG